jgi:hypothetical protein
MKARVHGYPRHYHREAHLNIGAGREFHPIHHLCLPEMLQTRDLSAESYFSSNIRSVGGGGAFFPLPAPAGGGGAGFFAAAATMDAGGGGGLLAEQMRSGGRGQRNRRQGAASVADCMTSPVVAPRAARSRPSASPLTPQPVPATTPTWNRRVDSDLRVENMVTLGLTERPKFRYVHDVCVVVCVVVCVCVCVEAMRRRRSSVRCYKR